MSQEVAPSTQMPLHEQDTLREGRVIGLDILRALAILFVLVGHGHSVPYFLRPIQNFGWAGVDLFFVLSGYLIGGLLLNDINKIGKIRFARFYLRRGFKIWPSYYIFLAVWGIFYDRHDLLILIPGVFHVQNYFVNPVPHTWSLAVEEHFYIMLPFLMMFLSRFGKNGIFKPIIIFWLFLVFNCFLLRLYFGYTSWSSGRFVVMNLQTQTQFRIDSLMGGVLLATIRKQVHSEAVLKRVRGVLVVFLLVGTPISSILAFIPRDVTWYIMVVWPLVLQLTFMSYLWIFKDFEIPRDRKIPNLLLSVMIFVAKISYNVYLWHWFVNAFLSNPKFSGKFFYQNFYIYFALSMIMGWLTTSFIEKPFLKKRDSLIP